MKDVQQLRAVDFARTCFPLTSTDQLLLQVNSFNLLLDFQTFSW